MDKTFTRRQRYDKIRASLQNARSSYDAQWRELGEFILPRRTRFFAGDRNKGDKRHQHIIDSTGQLAARTLSSGLHAGLTSPARPWFKLTTPDTKLAEEQDVAEWLETITERMQIVFADTNLYNVLPLVYGDMGTFGTSAMSMLEDDEDLFRCYSYPVGSYYLGLDERNRATTFMRDYELSVRQVVQQFGKRPGRREIDWTTISDATKSAWDNGDFENPVQLTWIVLPNEDADAHRLGSKYLPWASCHWELSAESTGAKAFLRESGFRTFPIMAPRWDITGEDSYGTNCPGMTALGDVKQLQIMQRRKAQAISKMVDPPLVGAPELRTQKTSLLAGDITYVRDPSSNLKAIHEIRIDLSHLREDMGETQYRVQRAYYEDLFLMLANSDQQADMSRQPITAREVDERHEEKLLALGPVLERTNDELLDPIIRRAFELMTAAGLIPPAPQRLQGVALKAEYISIMAQAQKLTGVVVQDRFMQSVVPLAQVAPHVLNKINFNRVVSNYGAMLGADPRMIRTDEEADAMTQQQAQAAAQQADAANAQKLGAAVKSASQAKTAGGQSALDGLIGGVTAGVPSTASAAGVA